MDKLTEIENNLEGIEITLEKDTFVFKKHKSNGKSVFREAALEKGETIKVGDAYQIVRFTWDHREHEFTPWLDNPDAVQGDETSVRYIRTEDLPQDF